MEGWVTCCQPFDPIATLCMWHALISFSFLSAPAPYQLNQNKNNPIAILKTYEECWGEEGHIEKGNRQLKFLNSGAKLDIMSTIQRERECVCGGGGGREGSTGAVYGQCCLYKFRHWKFFLFLQKFIYLAVLGFTCCIQDLVP